MAIVTVPDEQLTLTDPRQVTARLARAGIDYEVWEPSRPVPPDAPSAEILAAYDAEIGKLKKRGGYVTVDVIDVTARTPGLDEMRAKFRREHWHDEDEVRFILRGRGVFHIRPARGPVIAVQVGPGDLIRVPRETRHWFDFCPEPEIRAVRLFQDPAGWVPRYTDSGLDERYETVCLGPGDLPADPPVHP